jgi:hypothetical protein
MIWGGISLMGKTELAFVYGNQDATDHTHTLRDYFNPFFDAVVAMAPDIKPRADPTIAKIFGTGFLNHVYFFCFVKKS